MPIPLAPRRYRCRSTSDSARRSALALLLGCAAGSAGLACATEPSPPLSSEEPAAPALGLSAQALDARCSLTGAPEPDESSCDPHLDITAGVNPTTYWVATTGDDDNNDGRSAAAPFRTLERAKLAARAVPRPLTRAIVINVRRGTYALTNGLRLTEADSGESEPGATVRSKLVIWKSYDGPGAARLLGGTKIQSWVLASGNEYYAPLDYEPDALFENGTPARKARFPNYQYDSNFPTSQGPYLVASHAVNPASGQLGYLEAAATNLPANSSLGGASIFLWPEGNKNINTKESGVTVSGTTPRRFTVHDDSITLRGRADEPGNDSVEVRFFVQGARALLDTPGEYFYDRAARRLYYRPYFGVTNAFEVVAPKTGRVVSFIGSAPAQHVHDIAFEGFSVENAAEPYDDAEPDPDGEKVHQAAIYLENAKDIVVRDVHVRGSRGHGIALFKWAKHNQIDRAWIEQVGGDGVFLGIDKGGSDAVLCNLIADTRIHDVGQRQGDAGGIWMGNVSRNKLQRGLIYRSPRYAIVFKPRVGHLTGDTPWLQRYTYGNTIRRYDIHDVMQDSADGGALTYAHFGFFSIKGNTPTTWPADTRLRNYFRDISVRDVYEHPTSADRYPPTCVHNDGDASGQSYSSVICKRIKRDDAPHPAVGCGTAESKDSCHVNHNETCAFAMSGNSWTSAYPYDNLVSSPATPSDIGLSDEFPTFEDVFPYHLLRETFETQRSRNWQVTGSDLSISDGALRLRDLSSTTGTIATYPLEAPMRKLAVRTRFKIEDGTVATILRLGRADGTAAVHVKSDGTRIFNKGSGGAADVALGSVEVGQWYELLITVDLIGPYAISVKLGTGSPRAIPIYNAASITDLELSTSEAGFGTVWWSDLDVTTTSLPPAPSPQ